MKSILIVSDLHYSLPQFDWLLEQAADHDLIIVAGDMMELGSTVDAETQATVVEKYFRLICEQTALVACSGNHDLVDDFTGDRSTEWLRDMEIPGLIVDYGFLDLAPYHLFVFPWWESDEEKDHLEGWLKKSDRNRETEIWVHHAPPQGTRVAWNGKKDLGDPVLTSWIETYQPFLVFCGHIHNAPYYPDGGWEDRMGRTRIFNAGKQGGNSPATMIYQIEEQTVTWCGMEGCQTLQI